MSQEPVAEAATDRTAITPRGITREQLARAKGYPYPRPACSFVFVEGQALLFDDAAWPGVENWVDLHVTTPSQERVSVTQVLKDAGIDPKSFPPPNQWTPVLGIGSNGSPEQLARKFPHNSFPQAVIPTIRCALQDFDVVYAPLISSYGSATATLEHSPGTCVEVCLTYLTPPLLERMHATEGAYTVVRLHNISLAVGATPASLRQGVPAASIAEDVLVYLCSDGTSAPPIHPQQQPIAIKEVPATARSFTSLTQTEMQLALKAWLQRDEFAEAADPAQLDEWIASNLTDTQQRWAYVKQLVAHARSFAYKDTERMQTLEDMLSDSVK